MALRQIDEHQDQPLQALAISDEPTDEAARLARYLASCGTECPHCHSGDIAAYGINIDQGAASQSIICNACHAEWADCYTLTGIEEIGDPDKPSENEDEETKPYKVYLWKTVVLEVTVDAVDADAARHQADTNFTDGKYDGKWDEADTTSVDTICEESDQDWATR